MAYSPAAESAGVAVRGFDAPLPPTIRLTVVPAGTVPGDPKCCSHLIASLEYEKVLPRLRYGAGQKGLEMANRRPAGADRAARKAGRKALTVWAWCLGVSLVRAPVGASQPSAESVGPRYRTGG